MWEYQIENIHTGEIDYLWGYNWGDALGRRPDLDIKDWRVMCRTYID